MTLMNINPLILIKRPCSKNISEGQFNRPQWYIIFRSLFILRLIPLRNFEISSNFSSIIRQDDGDDDDNDDDYDDGDYDNDDDYDVGDDS